MASESRLQIVIDAQNNAQKAFESLKKDMEGVSKKFDTESKIIGSVLKGAVAGVTVLGAGVTAFGVSSFNAFRDSQVAMARFNSALATTGKAGIAAKDQLLAAADAAVKLGFDDEDAAESLGKFFQRTKDVTQSLKLNQVAMDLSRAKNIDLADASKMVNLVLSGNGKALKDYGIILKEGQSPLQALGELQKQVAGQSEAFSKTIDGSMQVLGVTFGNLQESIGGALATAIQPALEGLAKFAQTKEVQDALAQLTSFIETNFKTAVESVTQKIKDWYESVGGVDGIKEKLTALWNKLNDDIIPVIQRTIDIITDIIGFIYDHRTAIFVAIAAWEAYKISVLAIQGVAAIAKLAMLSIPTSIVITVGIVSIIAAIKAADNLRSAMDDVTGATSKALDQVQKLIDKANKLDKNDPNRKKLLNAAQNSAQSVSKANSDYADSYSWIPDWVPGRATGGSVMSGKGYKVGENGTEMFYPTVSGRIDNNPSSGGGHTNVFNFDFSNAMVTDEEQLVRKITETINRRQELYSIGAI